jgi:hypothetical protein
VTRFDGELKKVWCFGKNSSTTKEMEPWIDCPVDLMRHEGVEGISPDIPNCAIFRADFSFEWREVTVRFSPKSTLLADIQ